ncbi:mandelate racemase/muconate lactonizing enzyme family protein [Haladaptatus salinisoli]|uniref:mandelate racemase/muconate lactonizing enzyme family protein n=1 Tax=Haladaptatus salinisoli TaxID=2884876 RepID=UPI001D09A9C5|nr:mandelate racemase/muconate lactonizing enzyme family protein [Haladaptatus salinisoli]
MRLSEVTVHTLSSPIKPSQDRRFYGGVRRLHKRDFVLVRVETVDGLVGYAPGAATSSAMREYFDGTSHDNFATLIEDQVRDALAHTEIETPEDIAKTIKALDLPTKIESEAIGVIDVAYYDILGKQLGAPVYALLADREVDPDPLELYASAGMYMEPKGYAEQARILQDRGFTAYKYRPGLGVEADKRTLRLIRDTVGDEMDVMVDAHTWWKLGKNTYNFEQVVKLLDTFEKVNPYWVEEPVEPADYDTYQRLANQTALPLAGGESEETVEGLLRLAETGISYLQGDTRHHAGFTGCWQAIRACSDREDITFVPHNFGTQLGLITNAHLIAASPESPMLEYPVFGEDKGGMYPFPLAEDILHDELQLENGALEVPNGPGLGVEVNENVVEEYPYIEGAWTEFIYK